MRNAMIIILLLALPPLQNGGQAPEPNPTGSPCSLATLLELARKNNLMLKIAGFDNQISRQEYRQVRALPNPEIEFAAGEMRPDNNDGQPTIWSASAKWAMPNPFLRHFTLQAEKQNLAISAIELEKSRFSLDAQVKSHFHQLRFWLKTLELLSTKHANLEKVNTITQKRVDIGESPAIDMLRSSVELQKINSQRFKAEKNIARIRDKLREILNFSLPPDFTVDTHFDASIFTPLPLIEENLETLTNKSPLIRISSARNDRARHFRNAAPFSLVEQVEFFAEKEKEPEGKKWKIGIGFSFPLFDQKGALIKKNRLQYEKSQTELEHDRKHFLAEIQQTLSQIRILEKEIVTFQGAILEEGRKNLELTETLYKTGETSLMIYLDARNSFFDLEERYYEALTEWELLKASLEEQLGEQL